MSDETPAQRLSRYQRLLTSRIVGGVYPWGPNDPPPPPAEPLTFEKVKAMAEKLSGNGLAAGLCVMCWQRPRRAAPKNGRGEEITVGYLTCEECVKQ